MQALVDRVPSRLHPHAGFLAWLVTALFGLWLYWDGLQAWFFQDDFAWLGLLRQVHTPREVLHALFDPAAQGTIRPFSDRGFFLLFDFLFGVDSLPLRLAVFAVMGANLALLIWLMRRLTATATAGLVAGLVWLANPALVTVMTWNSAFNEALCPLFLLAALALFIRFGETGRWSYWWWQLAVFVLGFGVLEINVVYPALAAAWVVFVAPAERRRQRLISILPLVLISIAYFGLHLAFAPTPKQGAYALHFDREVLRSARLYSEWSLFPVQRPSFLHFKKLAKLIFPVCLIGVLGFVLREFLARRKPVLFFIAWFAATIAPLLPLADHRMDYYLTIPLIGLGMLAGYAFVSRPDTRWRLVAAVPLLAYLIGMVPVTRTGTLWRSERTQAIQRVVEGVQAARQYHPSKIILLHGVTTDLFNDALGHSPFYPLGIEDVYLTPGSEKAIHPLGEVLDLEDAVLAPSIVLRELKRDNAVVYSSAGDHFRNITEEYERGPAGLLTDRLPSRVDPGNRLFGPFLGPEWLPVEDGFRWMPGNATVKLRGPEQSAGAALVVDGYCPEDYLRQHSRRVWVKVDGIDVGEAEISNPESSFHRLFPLPPALAGRNEVTVELAVEPVVHQSQSIYGLVFGKIAIVP